MIHLSPGRARPLLAALALALALTLALALALATAPAGPGTAGLATATPAADEAAPLALYSSNSGSLPPRYAWSLAARIAADGTLRAEYCTGYGPPGGACREAAAALPAATLAAILQAARGSDLLHRPARELDPPPVGGPVRRGSVRLEQGEVRLPGFPVAEDAGRVAAVLDLLAEAVAGAVRFEGDPVE